jgi:hypothetical protein
MSLTFANWRLRKTFMTSMPVQLTVSNRQLQFQEYRSGHRHVLYSGLKVAKIRKPKEGENKFSC